ncbi:MAG: AAA family ATPase [Chitinophagales bacterium]
MKGLPTGRQNFKAIVEEGLIYVDKTQQIYNLISKGKLYFLSRPRRFGKSLLISTFQHIFGGYKDLFKDLYIGQKKDYDWLSYPVLKFNFASYGYQVENLEESLSYELQKYAKEYDVEISTVSLSVQFKSLVEQISQKGKPVVVLIDEYDKPIVDFLTDTVKAKKNQHVLRDFFSPLKDLESDEHLHFLFVTGVSKFSKVSLFSDLNNLTDLSIDPLSTDLVGITHKELLFYFDAYIQKAAEKFKMSKEGILQGIKLWYNGYSFDGEAFLYNPYSILSFFGKFHFGNFWFATGTPTFLVKSIRNNSILPMELENKEVPETFFDKFALENLDIVGLLFQTGYLTIKKTKRKRYEMSYFLGYPNIEVRKSLVHNLLEAFTYQTSSVVGVALLKMQGALEEGNVGVFIEQLKVLLSDISYHLLPKNKKQDSQANQQKAFEVWEGYFQTIIYLVTAFMGLYVQTEITKHQGRLDLLAETDDFLYIMEFKLDEPADDAIQQIKNRKYTAAYKNSPKTIYLVGIGFSKKERNVENWKIEEWKRI